MKKIYYGKETKKAMQNFPFSHAPVHSELILAISEIKQAAATTHKKIGHFSPIIADAIIEACKDVRNGKFASDFFLSGLQGGAGTSINMNVNEVIASRSEEILIEKGTPLSVHPNDHVNKSQSTNDVNPSALKIACIRLINDLLSVLEHMSESFEETAIRFTGIDKLGRTHLQDAIPTTLSDEFSAYAEIIQRDKKRILEAQEYLYELNLGGTAIGNCINASVEYRRNVYEELRKITNFPVRAADNLMSQTSSQTDFVMLSQSLVALTLDMSKIASDLRLLSSGPFGGIGEIIIKELQSGSSIMPGKINPILPETVNQVYFMVSGNNTSIEQAAHAAQLELGVMFPIIADRLLSSIKTTTEVMQQFATACVPYIHANKSVCMKHLEQSTAFATLLTPILGYDKVSNIVKESVLTGKTIRQIVLEKNCMTEAKFEQTIHFKCSRARKINLEH